MNCNMECPEYRKLMRSIARYLVSLVVAESVLLYGIGIHHLSDLNLGIWLQMIITLGSVTMPWLTDKPNGKDHEITVIKEDK